MQDYEKISPSALLVAALRAKYTDLPYAKEIYAAAKNMRKPYYFSKAPSLISRLGRFYPRNMHRGVFFEARYLLVNKLLEDIGDEYAVVEIASGLSSRGLEWSKRDSIYIETDLPDMLRIKKHVIDKILIETRGTQNSHHYFYPLNVMDCEDWERLGQAFFSEKKHNIAVIHEGLANYLSRDEKDVLRDNIKRFLRTYASLGVWITPDFYPYGKRHKTWIVDLVEKCIESRTERKYHYFRC